MADERIVKRSSAEGESTQRPYMTYRDTQLWAAVASVFADLQSSGEVRVDTAPEYVIGYFCRELVAKSLVTPAALTPEK